MRRFGLLLVAGAMSVAGAVSAGGLYCDGLELIGEYLYIRPHMCDLNYVQVDDRAFGDVRSVTEAAVDAYLPFGQKRSVCPNYESAFRVGAGYRLNCGCSDVTVTYTRLRTTDTSHAAATGDGGLWIMYALPRYAGFRLNNANIIDLAAPMTQALENESGVGIAATATLKMRFEYNMADGVLAVRRMRRCGLGTRWYVGLRWADICVHKAADYAGTVTNPNGVVDNDGDIELGRIFSNQITHVRSKTDTWGIGPRVGADLRYATPCGLGLGAHLGASVLVGNSSHHIEEEVSRNAEAAALIVEPFDPITLLSPPNVAEMTNIHSNRRCHLIPELDARLGVNYLWCCDCFSLLVEVGWEFVTYINAIGRIRFNDVAGTNREVCESYDMDGLYVSFKLAI